MSEEINLFHSSDSNFERDVLQSEEPALVDFWAEWCGPCQALGPIFAETAKDYSNKVRFVKFNVDENPKTAPNYGIRGIPTLLFFKNGKVVATKTGALSKKSLIEFIDSNL